MFKINDLVWIKQRDGTKPNNVFDSVRGPSSVLESNDTSAADTTGDRLNSFDADGFDISGNSNVNWDTKTFVAWNWKAGGAPTADNSAGAGATPTAGSVKIDGSNLGSALAGDIAATRISANTTSGFSIVSYTGADVAGNTVAHGLSQAPELIIVKDLWSTEDWQGYDVMGGPTKYIQLNDNGGYATDTTRWNDTAPTASVFSLGTSDKVNDAGDTYVAYCFHTIEGYSKIGNYTGNGVDNAGPFVYLGFQPAWVLIKATSAARDWWISDNKRDPFNDNDIRILWPNEINAEANYTNYDMDYVSNGFKVMGDNNKVNENNTTYLYLAYAESPFKTTNAR